MPYYHEMYSYVWGRLVNILTQCFVQFIGCSFTESPFEIHYHAHCTYTAVNTTNNNSNSNYYSNRSAPDRLTDSLWPAHVLFARSLGLSSPAQTCAPDQMCTDQYSFKWIVCLPLGFFSAANMPFFGPTNTGVSIHSFRLSIFCVWLCVPACARKWVQLENCTCPGESER